MQILIINDDNLLDELKNKISVKPSHVSRRATGIPTNAETTMSMHKLTQVTEEISEEVKNLILSMCATISDAIDAKALENGQASASEANNLHNGLI